MQLCDGEDIWHCEGHHTLLGSYNTQGTQIHFSPTVFRV